jgi:3-oxoacyl-[acyl-carrier protein] reductase
VAKIEGNGGRAVAAQADIADPAAVARLFDTAEAASSHSAWWITRD